MKKIITTFLFIAFSYTFCLADEIIISPNELPQNIKNFISQYFPGTNVMYAEIDYNEYNVRLNCGTEIDFTKNGEWKEIKAYQNFPTELLPANAVQSIKKQYPQAFIVKAEKNWNGFEIKTSNMMEMYFDKHGKLLGQQFDD